MQQAVVEKLSPSLERDLRALPGGSDAPGRSAEERSSKAEEIQREVRATLARLEKLLGAEE